MTEFESEENTDKLESENNAEKIGEEDSAIMIKLKKTDNFFKRNFCIYMPAVIIVIVMFAIFIAEKITPFGPYSLTIVDSIHQYVPFFSDYRNKILSGESLFYTWDVALGSNFLSLASYYLTSPFNLLLLLVSQEHIVPAVCIIMVIKLALTGSSMAYYLTKIDTEVDAEEKAKRLHIIGLSLMYTFSNYVIGYYWNTMWLDCLMILPLIMLGFKKLMEQGRPLMYCLTLFYALFCNYYIGYMICIFLVIYFFVYNHGGILRFIVNGLKFGACSLVAGGMAAMLLVPAYYGIKATAAGKFVFPKESKYGSYTALLKQHFMLTKPITNMTFDGGVNLYCGVLAIFTVILFLFCRSIKITEKIKTLVMLVFFIASYNSTRLNFIWHGLHDQYGIPNRFSFLYIFVLVVIAYKVLNRVDEIKTVYVLVSMMAGVIGTYYVYFMERTTVKYSLMFVTILLIFFYAGIFLLRECNGISRACFNWVIMVSVCCEMIVCTVNGFLSNGYYDYYTKYKDSPNVHAAYKETESWATPEDGFYRTELMDTRVLDESSWFNMRSLGVFCSTVNGELVTAMGKLGFYTGANEFLYMGSTPFTNSLFNIRYLFKREGDLDNYGYNYVATVDGVEIYENPYPLQIGYAVSSNVKDMEPYGADKFHIQNVLAYDMTGIMGQFKIWSPELDSHGENCETTVNGGNIRITPTGDGKISHIESFTVWANGDYYVNCRGNHTTKIRFSINGEEMAYDRYQIQIFHLGELKEGDYVSIEYVYDKPPKKEFTADISIAMFDRDVYEDIYRILDHYKMYDVTYKEGYVKGKINIPAGKILFTTIPYDKGWSVKVDGRDAEYCQVLKAFIGVELPPGEHEVEFKYTPLGWKLGFSISIICWGVLVIMSIFMPKIYACSTDKRQKSH